MKLLRVQFESLKKPEPMGEWEKEDERDVTEIPFDELVTVNSEGAINIDDIQYCVESPITGRTVITLSDLEGTTMVVVEALDSFIGRANSLSQKTEEKLDT